MCDAVCCAKRDQGKNLEWKTARGEKRKGREEGKEEREKGRKREKQKSHTAGRVRRKEGKGEEWRERLACGGVSTENDELIAMEAMRERTAINTDESSP